MPCGDLIEERPDRMVGRHLAVRGRGFQKRNLQIAELLPIDHVGVEIDLESLQSFFDVGDRELRIPAVVEVHREWPQPQVFHDPGYISAIHAARNSDDAVIGFAASGPLYLSREFVEPVLALSERD